MCNVKTSFSLWVFIILFTISMSSAFAARLTLTPHDLLQNNVQQILDDSTDGDVIFLSAGKYPGNLTINHQITLTSAEPNKNNVIIDAQGQGHGLILKNSNITISHLTIVNWGDDLTEENSAIYVNQASKNLVLNHNHLSGDGFGIWLTKADNAHIHHNVVTGNLSLRSSDRGNGIQLSSVKNSHVHHNETSQTRDGIYVIASQDNIIENNTMHHLRYGIHYMYSYDNSVLNNNAYNTRAGYAMMSSRRLLISGNTTTDSEDYGFLFNFITESTIKNNHIKNVWTKPENKVLGRDGKGLFVYNSGYNTFTGNSVDTAEIGIHLTAGSEKVKIYGNSFINNPIQVKYVSNKKQEWSKDQQGNYWSNYLGWDMDNNGTGDTVFEPNDGIDNLVWQYPEMKMIMDSPAILILRWVQRQFPVLKPPGIKDSFPLMHPPESINNMLHNKRDESINSNSANNAITVNKTILETRNNI